MLLPPDKFTGNSEVPKPQSNAKGKFLAACIVLAVVYIGFSFAFHAFADPPTSPYTPGETLSPTCSPTSTNCTVLPPLFSTTTLAQGGLLYMSDNNGTVTAATSSLYWNQPLSQFQIADLPSLTTTSTEFLLGPNQIAAPAGNPLGTWIGINEATSLGADFLNFEMNSTTEVQIASSGAFLFAGNGQVGGKLTVTSTFTAATSSFFYSLMNVSDTPVLTTSSALLTLGPKAADFTSGGGTWIGASAVSTSNADFLDFMTYVASATTEGSVFRVASTGALTVSSTAFSIFTNLSSTKFSFLNATSTGNLGLGSLMIGTTTAPAAALLTIATTTNIFRVFNYGAVVINGTSTLPLPSGATAFMVCAKSNCLVGTNTSNTAVAWFASPDGTNITQSIGARGYITGGLNDVGEFIPVVGGDADYTQGDVVSPTESSSVAFQQSATPYDPTAAGVITTTAGLIAGGGDDSHSTTVIALAGRVPVNVTMENGPIHVGDFLTSSDIPGAAMRATQPGRVIGLALQDDLGNPNNPNATSQVMMFVNPGWSLGNLTSTAEIASSTWALEGTGTGNATVIDQFTAYVQAALAKLGVVISNGVATLQEIVADKVATNQLCVQGVCVNGNQLQNILNTAADPNNLSPGIVPASGSDSAPATGTPPNASSTGSSDSSTVILAPATDTPPAIISDPTSTPPDSDSSSSDQSSGSASSTSGT